MSKINVYQSYFDASQRRDLIKGVIPFYTKGLLSPFIENSFILAINQLERQTDSTHWGLISWDANGTKNRGTRQRRGAVTIDQIYNAVEQFDVVALATFSGRGDIVGSANRVHGGKVGDVIKMVCDHMKIEVLKEYPKDRIVMQNQVITSKQIFSDYIDTYLLPACEFLIHYPEYAFRDSGYQNGRTKWKEAIQKQLGLDYLPIHTFVLERLWTIYLANHPQLTVIKL
jgi:hypothetical protein